MDIISKSESLIQWIDSQIDGLEVPSHERGRIVAGCYDTALEHQKAIIILVHRKLYGSAFALTRSVLEAYIRGVWFHYCASDKEIADFLDDNLEKTFGELIESIETLEGYSECVLSAAKASGLGLLNSFTHTGFAQIVRRCSENYIEPNYRKEEIEEFVDFVNSISMLVAMEISLLAKQTDIEKYLEKIKEYAGKKP